MFKLITDGIDIGEMHMHISTTSKLRALIKFDKITVIVRDVQKEK